MKAPQILSCIVLAAGVQMAATTLALDFRVETDVFIGNDKEPVAENLTLFSDGQVYDFVLSGSREITIYDPARGQFKLLDTERKLKSSVSTQNLLELVEGMEGAIAKGGNPYLRALVKPTFETKVEEFEDNGETRVRVTMTSKEITYKVVGQRPQHAEAVHAYRQFGDFFSRFNAVRKGGLLPGARLALDQVLAERGLVPIEVERIDSTPGRKLEVRSRHLINWILSKQDHQRITDAGNYLAEFKDVDFEEHRGMPPVKVATKAAGTKPR
ncbi:MAG: hypothetical protein ACKVP0_17540 [Pirellulaceae bacterium]